MVQFLVASPWQRARGGDCRSRGAQCPMIGAGRHTRNCASARFRRTGYCELPIPDDVLEPALEPAPADAVSARAGAAALELAPRGAVGGAGGAAAGGAVAAGGPDPELRGGAR